jgi:hypothetical protein
MRSKASGAMIVLGLIGTKDFWDYGAGFETAAVRISLKGSSARISIPVMNYNGPL